MKPEVRHHRGPQRVAFTVLVAAALVVALSGCGNLVTVHDAGQLGISVDEAGRPVLAVMTCSRARPVIDLSEGRKKADPESRPNTRRGGWQARHPFTGVRRLNLTSPSATWATRRAASTLEAGTLFIVDGGTLEDADASLTPVDFHVGDLAALTPDDVLVNGKTESWRAFGAYTCQS